MDRCAVMRAQRDQRLRIEKEISKLQSRYVNNSRCYGSVKAVRLPPPALRYSDKAPIEEDAESKNNGNESSLALSESKEIEEKSIMFSEEGKRLDSSMDV